MIGVPLITAFASLNSTSIDYVGDASSDTSKR